MFRSFIATLHDPAVRDLAWVISSPGLLDATHPAYQGHVVDDLWCEGQLRACAAWLTALNLSPAPLHDFIRTRPTRRLGHYFETLITFWLTRTPETQLIATNLQVQDEQRTSGEYDFLFRDARGMVHHWEVAIKFYLQVEPRSVQHAFIGPGTRDRLDLKLNKVFQQQLLLSHTAAGQRALPQGIRPDETQAFIKGYLFYHAATTDTQSISGVSATHLSGWWVRHALEKLPKSTAESRWALLPRLRWLAPAYLADEETLMTYQALNKQLDRHFSANADAVLVFEMLRSPAGGWAEISRGFVVCSSWPIIAASAAS
jgi:hypothetical protein